ncbi:hypothetical protein MMC27_003127 [Xylographa pallens]|nr:hypothetical protein [Xylographa pallens]
MDVSVALQWTLDQTVDHFLKLGADVLLTATRDNVQPIALLACEHQNRNVVFDFLKTKIGYPKGDSATQLAKSLAGVNFLALAAVLVSTTNTFEADLLNVLEPGLNRAGFMDEVLNWKAWWMGTNGLPEIERAHVLQDGEAFPSSDGLEKIVMALRANCRIGEATSVKLTARSAAPWLTAFVTWCVGVCPTIYGSDGHAIHTEPDVPLKIVYSEHQSFDKEIRIEITNTSTSFDEVIAVSLVDSSRTQVYLAAGMTKVENYAKYTVASMGFDSDLPENPFPPESVIADVMKTYLSLSKTINLMKLPEGGLMSDLPLAVCG